MMSKERGRVKNFHYKKLRNAAVFLTACRHPFPATDAYRQLCCVLGKSRLAQNAMKAAQRVPSQRLLSL